MSDASPNVIDPQELVKNPLLLLDSFDRIVGQYNNLGMGGAFVDVEKLLEWEKVADAALMALSLEELRYIYECYKYDDEMSALFDYSKANVVYKKIASVCVQNDILHPHIKYGAVLDETCCDTRVMHLVANRGRYPVNLDEAFAAALGLEEPAPASQPTGILKAQASDIKND